jgi:RNA polymerase sigma-70 factor (ECF subfamily)
MTGQASDPLKTPPPLPSFGTISVLVERARLGDSQAREQLAQRCIEALRRFASGRVPRTARARLDTDDLVQTAVMRAFERLHSFEHRGHGSFLAHLRTIVLNAIRDEARRLASRMPHQELVTALPVSGPSPLEAAIGNDVVDAYESALTRLPAPQREAVILRLEMGYSYDEVADAVASPSPNAARMMVTRALVRLAQDMESHGRSQAV